MSEPSKAARTRAFLSVPLGAFCFGFWMHSVAAGLAFGLFLEVLNDLREGKS